MKCGLDAISLILCLIACKFKPKGNATRRTATFLNMMFTRMFYTRTVK